MLWIKEVEVAKTVDVFFFFFMMSQSIKGHEFFDFVKKFHLCMPTVHNTRSIMQMMQKN